MRDTGQQTQGACIRGPVLVAHEAERMSCCRRISAGSLRRLRGFRQRSATCGWAPASGWFLQAVGVKGGLLLAFKPEAVYVKGRKKRGACGRPCPHGNRRGEGNTALVNGDIE
jgi:hypothetical protein